MSSIYMGIRRDGLNHEAAITSLGSGQFSGEVSQLAGRDTAFRQRWSRRLKDLSVIALDQRAFGGQAGASARIENYLGFPTGISGLGLAGRAFNQALKFGVEIAIPVEVARLDCDKQKA